MATPGDVQRVLFRRGPRGALWLGYPLRGNLAETHVAGFIQDPNARVPNPVDRAYDCSQLKPLDRSGDLARTGEQQGRL